MSVMVKNLLSLPIYRDHAKILSKKGIENEVTDLTIMEAPDFNIDTLGQKTMILTTLSAYADSLDSINSIIEKLCTKGIAAVAVKIGRFVNTIDESTVRIVSRYSVPLIAVDKHTYFREILSQSLLLISDDQHEDMRNIISFDNDLKNAMFWQASYDDILQIFTSRTPCYCCLIDMKGKILAQNNTSSLSFSSEDMEKAIQELSEVRRNDRYKTSLRKSNEYIIICGNQKNDTGYLYVKTDNQYNPVIENCIYSMSRMLSFRMVEQIIAEQTKERIIASVLDQILFSNNNDEDESMMADRLMMFDFIPQDVHGLVLVEINESDAKRDYLETIRNIFHSHVTSVIVFKQGNYYIVLLSEHKSREKRFKRIVEEAGRKINEVMDIPLYIGASMEIYSLKKYSEAYMQAKRALFYGKQLNKEKNCYFYNDYLEIGLLAHALHSSSGDLLLNKIVKPIHEYDQKYDMVIWDTMVRCFYTVTLSEVANELYIHISTLRYRLQRIEDITGYNYFDRKDHITLYLAYLLYLADQADKLGV